LSLSQCPDLGNEELQRSATSEFEQNIGNGFNAESIASRFAFPTLRNSIAMARKDRVRLTSWSQNYCRVAAIK